MRKIVLCSMLLATLNFKTIQAAQLNIDGDYSMMGNEVYSDNRGVGTAGAGIYADGTSGNVNTNGNNLTVDNNIDGINLFNGSVAGIAGNGFNFLFANNNERYAIDVSSSNLNIENININLAENFRGINAVAGANVSLVSGNSNMLNITGADYGILSFSTDLSTEVNIEGYDVSISNISSHGVALNGGRGVTIKGGTNRNNLFLKDISGIAIRSSGVTTNTGVSAITISDMNVFVENAEFVLVKDDKTTNIINSDIYMNSNNRGFSIEDNGTINLNNVVFRSVGETLLRVFGANVGNFNVNNSDVMGEIVTESGVTSNVTLTDTVWRNVSKSNISNFVASNADIYMNIFFGMGDTGDRLMIEGSSSGAAILYVNPVGADGSQNDVLLVDQNSATQKDIVFSLYGGIVDSGFYEYYLVNDSDNWYLRSNGTMTNTARMISNIPATHLSIIKTGMNELRKRMGELRDNSPEHKDGLWARSYAKHLKVNESIDSHMNVYGFEVGYDYQIYRDCDNRVYVGLMMGYLYTDNIKTRNSRSTKGSGHANTPTVGAYSTWINKEGWFADATLRSFWSNMEVSSYSSQGQVIKFDPDRQFTTGTLEFGRQLSWDVDRYSSYILEPKVELGYAYAKSKKFSTNNLNNIGYGSTESVQGRIGLMAGYNTELENGAVLEPFVEISLIEEWGGRTDISYAGGDFKSDISGTSVEFGGGLNAKIDDSWNLYSDVMYETGSVIKALSTTVGVRYNF